MRTITRTTVTEKYDKNGKLVEKTTTTDTTSYFDGYCNHWHTHTSPYWNYSIGTNTSSALGTMTTNTFNSPTSITTNLPDGGWQIKTTSTLTDN